jgi:multisubunit Na+/H+ antiporter MnhB subunit
MFVTDGSREIAGRVARHLLLQEPRRSADAVILFGLGGTLLFIAVMIYLSGGSFSALLACGFGMAVILLGLGDTAYRSSRATAASLRLGGLLLLLVITVCLVIAAVVGSLHVQAI